MRAPHSPPVSTEAFSGRSFILHEKGQHHRFLGTGGLSIKAFFGGQARYETSEGTYIVDDSSYLILNQGRRYSVEVDAKEPVESLCLFWGSEMSADVYRSVGAGADELLDDPAPVGSQGFGFFERTYPHDRLVTPLLLELRSSLAGGAQEPEWVEERLHEIAEALFRLHRRVDREVEGLPALRRSTRAELYRRLHRARDFILAHFDSPIGLSEISRAACLSPNHLLRSFRQVFHQTPHQFLTGRRLDKARDWLERSDLPVTEICHRVGYESLGSFSRLFRSRTGVSPRQFRSSRRC